MALEKGAVVDGIVTGITNFGAFVSLPENKVGLIHISEVSNVFVKDVHDFLKVKDKVTVKVVSIDDKGKIGLSLKALMPPAPAPERKPAGENRHFENRHFENKKFEGKKRFESKPFHGAPRAQGPMSFEDKLSRFLKESDDRLLDLKRNTESKRGGRGARRGD
ncbi:S1 RNA-binding domain-containing protein [uncultured Acidaminococcus sp.]|jgi:S1 RNA binding domain protein|uniref:S1 RNA-binding domain-containing protein n=1 Tax=Acidaminococcus sp. TaxID=1872103 RepID=UPI00265FA228|nr:S1 RNA-binding domain-containing protein [uncultured Acidaminococcus sp.]